jgi:hypothetical protein
MDLGEPKGLSGDLWGTEGVIFRGIWGGGGGVDCMGSRIWMDP